MKKLLYKLKALCNKCPYKSGVVQTVVNPCPRCKFDIEKALSLSEGVEPVVYVCKNILDEKSKRKILSTLKWENGSWKMKKSFFPKLKMK